MTDGIHQFGAAQLRRSAAHLYAEAHPNRAGYFGPVSSPQAISRTQRRLFLTYNSMAVSDAFKYFFREGVMNVGAAGELMEVGARLDGKEL